MRRRGAFTLVELIVVLALVGLLAALIAPSFTRTIVSARLRSAASDVRGVLARARALAVAGARDRVVTFEPGNGTFGIDNDTVHRLPETIRLGGAGDPEEGRNGGEFRVRFFVDGSAQEAEIFVTAEDGGRLRVTVEPLTGIAEAGT